MKILIITSTLFFTFLLNPFSFENNNSELSIEKEKTHPIEIIDNCNTGISIFKITWNSNVPNAQRLIVRNSYTPYGRSPIEGRPSPNVEIWYFNLDNVDPSVIPPNTNCRRDLVDNKIEMQGEIEEHEEVSSGQF